MVQVMKITSMPLRGVAKYLGCEGDWPDTVMLDGMREHYPTIMLDDMVDVIEHEPFERQPNR